MLQSERHGEHRIKPTGAPGWQSKVTGGKTDAEVLSVLILAAGVVVGYSMRSVPAIAQAGDFQPFTLGQTVRLTVEGFPAGVTSITCKVAAVSNEFITCEGEGQRRSRAVNLRYVQEIVPGPER
jgi:hypothetical protein